jgi:histone deacetylase 11
MADFAQKKSASTVSLVSMSSEEDHTTLSSSSADPLPASSSPLPEIDLTAGKIPLIYHPSYNISLYGVERLLSHVLDGKKYGKVFASLSQSYSLNQDQVYQPQPVTDAELRKVHTQDYLDTLSHNNAVAKIANASFLSMFPQAVLQEQLLLPMKLATGGTVLATQLALKKGWAINLSGGYHHAKSQQGESCSFFADIPLAVRILLQHGVKKILIVDLDAHQGHGYQAIYALYDEFSSSASSKQKWVYTDDDRVHIFDMYNSDVSSTDAFARQFLTYDLPLPSYTEDEDYLSTLENSLVPSIRASSPEIVIYNAGTNIYRKDKTGKLSVSAEGIIQRDEFVFRTCRSRNIPIAMVLSGGNSSDCAKIISDSIGNLHEKGLISLTVPGK